MNDATIQKIIDIQPIPGADRIEVASVLGWKVVVKKGEYKVGDMVVYVCIDSVLPKLPQYEFIKNTKKNEKGEERYYVRTIRLRKQISQGLILPISVLSEKVLNRSYLLDAPIELTTLIFNDSAKEVEVGLDVSELLDVQHYEKQIHGSLAGIAKGNFPSFIAKTDEERIQNIPKIVDELRNKPYYITIKLDGTSFTAYYQEGTLGVCSRNLELKEDENSLYWKMAKKYDLLMAMGNHEQGYLAIQGEIVGPGIQGNPMGLAEIDLYVFNIYNITEGRYLQLFEMQHFCGLNELKMVPIVEQGVVFRYSVEQLLELAKGKYEGTDNHREGIVVRSLDKEISFKVLNNDFLEGEE